MGKKKAGGKKKKSKEELEAERLAFEEEERIRKEHEAELFAEQEKLRLEREEELRLERERLRAEELARLKEETSSSRALVERRKRHLDELLRNKKESSEWNEYLACSRLPRLDNNADLNSYLNSVASENASELENVLVQCEEMQVIVDRLQVIGAELLSRGDESGVEETQKKAGKVLRGQVKCIDRSTADILSNADEYVSPKLEVLLSEQSDTFKVGIWINMNAKGFRMKIIDFPGLGIVSEIPKTLAHQNIAVRVLQTRSDSITVPPVDNKAGGDDYDGALGGVFFFETLKLPPPRKNFKSWAMTPVNAAVDKRVQRLDFNHDADLSETGGVAGAGGSAISVSLKFALGNDVIVRDMAGKLCPLQVSPDSKEEGKDDGATQGELNTLAAVTAEEEDNSTPIRVGAWDAKKGRWTEEGITDVMFDQLTRVVSFSTTRMTAMAVLQKRCLDLPILTWTLRPLLKGQGALLTEGPEPTKVENWPAESDDEEEEKEYGIIRAETEKSSVEGALLTLVTDRWIVKIHLDKNGKCRLVEPRLAELDSLRAQWLGPCELLARLATSGINLIAPLQPHAALGVASKEPKLEDHVYQEIGAAVASSFSVCASQWNERLSADKVGLQLYQAGDVDFAANIEEEARSKSAAGVAQAQAEAQFQAQAEMEANKAETGEDGAAPEAAGTSEAVAGEEESREEDADGESAQCAGSETTAAADEPLKTGRSSASKASKASKGGKKKAKGKGKKGADEAAAEAADNQAAIEEEAKEDDEQKDEEPDAVAEEPRLVLYQVDEECEETGIKCSFLRVKDSADTFKDTVSKGSVTHAYLENALLASGIYDEANVRKMQDHKPSMSLRHTIATTLQTIRPITFTFVPK